MKAETETNFSGKFVSKICRVYQRTNWMGQYIVVFLIATGGAMIVHRVSYNSLGQPWRVQDSDLSASYAVARALGKSWFGMSDSYLGAPFDSNFNAAFPPEYIQALFTRILAHVFGNPFLAVNLFYILSYGLTALSTLWLCRRLKTNAVVGCVLSLSFAWLPYHFIRMDYGHVALAEYFMLPFGAWILICEFQLAKKNGFDYQMNSRQLLNQIVIALLVGASGTYYALFFSLLTLSLLPIGSKASRDWKNQAERLCRLLFISASFMIPTGLHQLWVGLHRTGQVSLGRSPEEAVRFGGSITRLLVPGGVPLPSKLSRVIPWEEFEWTVTPALVALGLWIMLSAVLSNLGSFSKDNPDERKSALLYLSFWSMLFYTTSGFGLMFAGYVSPIFRCWNRMSVLLSLFSLLFIALRILEVKKNLSRVIATILLCLLAVSQISGADRLRVGTEPDALAIQEAVSLKAAADVIERTVEDGCQILQLPIVVAFGVANVNDLSPSNQYWLPLFSPTLRWSFGAAAGTPAGDYWPRVSSRGIDALYQAALGNHFCGAVFDRRGYATDKHFFANIARFEDLAESQNLDLGINMRFVPIRNSKLFEK